MTNLNLDQLNALFGRTGTAIKLSWNVGRGKKFAFEGKDMMFMELKTLKHGVHSDFLSSIFKVKGSKFKLMILHFIRIIFP